MKFKKILKRLLVTITILIGLLVCFYALMGGFNTIEISESEEGPFYFIYQELTEHDYSGVEKITNELNTMLDVERIKRSPFDVFQPENSGLPNEIGFVVMESPNEKIINGITKYRVVPKGMYMKTIFPFKNRLSYMVGYVKINSALESYRAENNYKDAPAITINKGGEIIYLQPVIN
jgi:hypothetical protein